MRKLNFVKIFASLFIVAASAFVLSCSDITTYDDSKLCQVKFAVDNDNIKVNANSRTVFPAVEKSGFTSVVLKGTTGSATKTLGTYSSISELENTTVSLTEGSWNFELICSTGTNGTVFSGTTSAVVGKTTSAPQSVSFTISRSTYGTGKGTINVIFTVPSNVDAVLFAVSKDGEEEVSDKVTSATVNSDGTKTFVYSQTGITAGKDVAVKAVISQSDKNLATLREYVHVGTNLTSTWTKTLAADDLDNFYTVNYVLNGGAFGTEHSPVYYFVTKDLASADFELFIPERSGYSFGGWFWNADCSGTEAEYISNSSLSNAVNKTITLYAKWDEVQPDDVNTEYAETPAVTAITVYNGITGTNKKGTYSTVAAAIAACGSSGDYRIVLPKGIYSENGLVYNGSGTIRISGNTTAKYGDDVIIKGHGSSMPVDGGSSAQNARELLLFKGTGNLILENLTLQTDWLRSEHVGVEAMQAEVLGFNSSGRVAAYNCSFNSYQDTVRTVGKGWFYNCHIEGDVDFIWMEAGGKVALYEKCDIASNHDGYASAAYIAAPKISLGSVAGKGVVIKDSAVTAASGQTTYLFRNPWSSNASAQYNQAAFVDCTYAGTFVSALSKSDANGTSDQQYIGWKIDSAAASKFTGKSSKIGVLSDTTKTKEYSGRRAILNRNYMVDSAKFEKDTASNWDIDTFITTVGWSVQSDSSKDMYDGETVTNIYSWDFVANSKPSAGYLASTQDSSVKLYISGSAGSGGCPCFHPGSGAKIYIPAATGDKVEVVTHSGSYYNFTLAGKAASSNAESLTVSTTVSSGQSGDTNTYVLLSVTGDTYIHSISVTGSGSGSSGGDSGDTGGETGDLFITFENGPVASDSRVSSSSNKIYSDTSCSTYQGTAYTYGVKLNSTGSMTLTLEKAYTVVFVMGTDKSTYTKGLSIDGTVVAPVDNTVTVTLDSGEHTIKNGGSETSVYLIILKESGTSGSDSSSGSGTSGSDSSSGSGTSSGDSASTTKTVIKYTDTPLGFAGTGYSTPAFSKTVTVTTRAELMNAIKNENTLIYVNGMIDMSDEGSGSKLPAKNTSNIAVSSVMDDWIAEKSSNKYTTYQAWVTAYSKVVGKSTDDKKVGNTGNSELASTLWTLNNAWKSVIQLNLKSNTTIIGLGENSGLRGGTIAINGISNVVIRNLYLLDAIDMFPHHESGDGYNSQFDCITIQGSGVKNIWIDHCTFEDTMVMQHVTNGLDSSDEKWQNYDGSCDIKGDAAGVTVSNCHFFKHDKTMLIGSSDDEGDNTVRKISLINNYFDSCVQRLPMVRNTQIHILNNYWEFNKAYTVGDGKTKMSYAIGVRSGSRIYSEANYFGTNNNAAYANEKLSSSNNGNGWFYAKDCAGDSATKTAYSQSSSVEVKNSLTELGWDPAKSYSYTPMTAEEAKTYVLANAGHGTVTVEK